MGHHDIAQVCMSGHMVNDRARSSPQFNEDHCGKCGAATIDQCPECNVPIKGDYVGEVVVVGYTIPTPTHCTGCGRPYPWKAKIEKARKEKSEKAQEKKLLPERIKNSAIGALIVSALVAVGWLGDWWQKLPSEWREWLVKHVPRVEFKMPEETSSQQNPPQTQPIAK